MRFVLFLGLVFVISTGHAYKACQVGKVETCETFCKRKNNQEKFSAFSCQPSCAFGKSSRDYFCVGVNYPDGKVHQVVCGNPETKE